MAPPLALAMLRALTAGLAGAAALNALHESARRVLPEAPRVDLLGRELVRRAFHVIGTTPPTPGEEYALAMGGDLASNAVYYAAVAAGDAEKAPVRGLALGLAAGVATVLLPPYLGLSSSPVRRSPLTAALTVAWYTVGGVVAGAAYRALAR